MESNFFKSINEFLTKNNDLLLNKIKKYASIMVTFKSRLRNLQNYKGRVDACKQRGEITGETYKSKMKNLKNYQKTLDILSHEERFNPENLNICSREECFNKDDIELYCDYLDKTLTLIPYPNRLKLNNIYLCSSNADGFVCTKEGNLVDRSLYVCCERHEGNAGFKDDSKHVFYYDDVKANFKNIEYPNPFPRLKKIIFRFGHKN